MMRFASALDQVITQNLDKLQKPGVLSVRPGYQVANGWPTNKPAIVVTVDRKMDNLAPQDRLPETIGGYSVDVRQAGPPQRPRVQSCALHKRRRRSCS